MAWPTTSFAVGDVVTSAQMNKLPALLADSTLAADAASIDFTSIPSTFAHLMLVTYLRDDQAVSSGSAYLRFNAASGSAYDYQTLKVNGTTVAASEAFAQTRAAFCEVPGASSGSVTYLGGAQVLIPHYAGTAKDKTAFSDYVCKRGTATGDMVIGRFGLSWQSAGAITQVTLLPSAGNFVTGSRATLYGL